MGIEITNPVAGFPISCPFAIIEQSGYPLENPDLYYFMDLYCFMKDQPIRVLDLGQRTRGYLRLSINYTGYNLVSWGVAIFGFMAPYNDPPRPVDAYNIKVNGILTQSNTVSVSFSLMGEDGFDITAVDQGNEPAIYLIDTLVATCSYSNNSWGASDLPAAGLNLANGQNVFTIRTPNSAYDDQSPPIIRDDFIISYTSQGEKSYLVSFLSQRETEYQQLYLTSVYPSQLLINDPNDLGYPPTQPPDFLNNAYRITDVQAGDVYDHAIGITPDNELRIAYCYTINNGTESAIDVLMYDNDEYFSPPLPDNITVQNQDILTNIALSKDGSALTFVTGTNIIYVVDLRNGSPGIPMELIGDNNSQWDPCVSNVYDTDFVNISFTNDCIGGSYYWKGWDLSPTPGAWQNWIVKYDLTNNVIVSPADPGDQGFYNAKIRVYPGVDIPTLYYDVNIIPDLIQIPQCKPGPIMTYMKLLGGALAWDSGHPDAYFLGDDNIQYISLEIIDGMVNFYSTSPVFSYGVQEGIDTYYYCVFRNGFDLSGDVFLVKVNASNVNTEYIKDHIWEISADGFGLEGAYEDNPDISQDGKLVAFEGLKFDEGDIYVGYGGGVIGDEWVFDNIGRLTDGGNNYKPKIIDVNS
jgi:hypothetical protein